MGEGGEEEGERENIHRRGSIKDTIRNLDFNLKTIFSKIECNKMC